MQPNKSELRNMYHMGDSPWELLALVVNNGMEYPDAVWYVSSALNLDDEERQEMETSYDECI